MKIRKEKEAEFKKKIVFKCNKEPKVFYKLVKRNLKRNEEEKQKEKSNLRKRQRTCRYIK